MNRLLSVKFPIESNALACLSATSANGDVGGIPEEIRQAIAPD
ncbi:MAG: hypothetical protein CLLPBCKN_001520 [Chroococcidiopsis cubana SAG 39.79]|nr:hypothetical protein [Chroococcidiopsis cubana]MDZ4872132.1 hypothetical protein [Chroococcidiopsis cubana SAG 39.79]